MIALHRVENILARFPVAAAMLYIALVMVFVVTALEAVLDLSDRRDAVNAAADILGKLEGRGPALSGPASSADVAVVAGSPYLEGATVTIAGAALLKRLDGAVVRVGGNVLSSQVDLQGSQSKAGFVTATASCEVEAVSLQPLLYDLEAGMPFLFVDQLVVQAPVGSTTAPGGKMRVLLTISGQWQGAKS
jgi:general secretion pathway protein M